MSEDKKELDVNALVESINTGVSSKIDEKLEGIKKEIKNIQGPDRDKKLNEKPDYKFLFEEDEEDSNKESEYISKKDLPKILEAMKQEAAKSANQAVSDRSAKDQMDMKAIQDFPMLSRSSASFDPDFFKEVEKEINRKVSNGRNSSDPDLVYDAAAVVKASNPRFQASMDAVAKAQYNSQNTRNSEFFVSGSTKNQDPGKFDAQQMEYASRLGMDSKRVEWLKKNFNK